MSTPLPITLTVAVIAGLAAKLSLTLAQHSRSPEALPGCGNEEGCESVLSSRWSKIGGLPVAALAVAAYGLISTLALFAIPASIPATWKKPAWALEFTLGISAAGAAIWYLLLQLLVLRTWCVYCITIHILGLSLPVIMWTGTVSSAESRPTVSPLSLLLFAAAGVAMLIGGQLFLRPRQYAVQRSSQANEELSDGKSGAIAKESGTAKPGIRQPSDSASAREVRLLGGRVVIQCGPWPLLGSIQAPFVIAYLFDFTCPSCRRIHQMLIEAVGRLNQRLAVLMIPVPQEPQCNSYLRQASSSAQGRACKFARLALKVWHNAPTRYHSYEQWLFQNEELPPFDAALAHVRELTGYDNITDEEIDVSINRLVATAADVQHTARTQKIPTILLPRATIAGEVPSIEELMKILQKEMGMQAPSK